MYQNIVQPILHYCSSCFFNVSLATGQTHMHNQHICQDYRSPHTQPVRAHCKAIMHIANTHSITQLLSHHSTALPSERRFLRCRKVRFGKRLVPAAMAGLNRLTHLWNDESHNRDNRSGLYIRISLSFLYII